MRLVLHSETNDLSPWLEPLQAQWPDAKIALWRQTSERGEPADYALVWRPSQSFLDAQPQLKGIINLGAGVDALLRLNIAAHIPVVRMVDAGMGEQMADYVAYAVLQHYRRFGTYARQQAASLWRELGVQPKAQHTVGVMGLGVLGKRVAQVLQYLGFPVLAWSASAKQMQGVRCFAGPDALFDFLRASRVVICMLPLTSQTRHILNAETLALLPEDAQVVNVGRGGLVDELALLAWLQASPKRSAFLDVFECEPLARDSALWSHPQTTLTPHVAALTLLDDDSVAQVCDSIRSLERGLRPPGWVDRDRGY